MWLLATLRGPFAVLGSKQGRLHFGKNLTLFAISGPQSFTFLLKLVGFPTIPHTTHLQLSDSLENVESSRGTRGADKPSCHHVASVGESRGPQELRVEAATSLILVQSQKCFWKVELASTSCQHAPAARSALLAFQKQACSVSPLLHPHPLTPQDQNKAHQACL